MFGSRRAQGVFPAFPDVSCRDERDAVSAGIRDWRLPESGIRRFFVHFSPEKAPFIETPRIHMGVLSF